MTDANVAWAIERAAHAGGVAMARPVPTTEGGCWAEIDGRLYRCHEWVEGDAKHNEATSAVDARRMGKLVAHLHGLRISCPPNSAEGKIARERWENLAAAGRARNAPWAERLAEAVDWFGTLARQPGPTDRNDAELVGSHRDLNAHNVLFCRDGLRLIDWDGAGRVWPRWDRANYSLLWAQRGHGRYDAEAVVAFLRGYLDGGGTVEADDPSALSCAAVALAPWVAQNVEIALDRPTDQQDILTGLLVKALVAMPRTIARRQTLLRECLDRL